MIPPDYRRYIYLLHSKRALVLGAISADISAILVLVVFWVAVLHVEASADMEPQAWSITE